MPETHEQNYELTMSHTIVFNLLIVLLIFAVFPLLKWLFPQICMPQRHLPFRRTSIWCRTFWFVDVFAQPLSVYATRGNFVTIYVVFQQLLIGFYFVISVVTCSILLPMYYQGTDSAFNVNYLTNWSKLTFPHLEENNLLVFVPYLLVILLTWFIMLFYEQFMLIYVAFKQRCLQRPCAQNFVVLLSNIPQISTEEELQQMLARIAPGVEQVVPIPRSAPKMSKLNSKVEKAEAKLEQLKLDFQKWKSELLYRKAMKTKYLRKLHELQQIGQNNEDSLQKFLVRAQQFYILEAQRKLRSINKKVAESCDKMRACKQELLWLVEEDNVQTDYLGGSGELEQMQKTFDYLPLKNQEEPEVLFKKVQETEQEAKSEPNTQISRHISSAAFLVCKSQDIAAEKQTALITTNQNNPKASLAPHPNEIVWQNLFLKKWQRNLRYILFILLIIGVFVGYIYGQSKIIGLLLKNQTIWKIKFFKSLVQNTDCRKSPRWCTTAEKVASLPTTQIPSWLNSILMYFLPYIMDYVIPLLGQTSATQNSDVKYKLLFLFYIIVQGMFQIAFPNWLDIETGRFDISWLQNFRFTTFIDSIGRNLVDQQFTFINYIINNYFTFPAMSLISVTYEGIYSYLKAKIFTHNSLEINGKLKFNTFSFDEQLSATSHMFAIAMIFSITAPITNIIVLVIYIMQVCIDRYFLLYISAPSESSDLTSDNMLNYVIKNIFTGLCFTLCSMFCHFLIHKSVIYYIGSAICAICLIGAYIYKKRVDSHLYRALFELKRSDWEFQNQILLNLTPDQPQSKSMNWLSAIIGRILQIIRVDLSKLPISALQFDGDERQIRLLQENDLLVTQLHEEQIQNVSEQFTHPGVITAKK